MVLDLSRPGCGFMSYTRTPRRLMAGRGGEATIGRIPAPVRVKSEARPMSPLKAVQQPQRLDEAMADKANRVRKLEREADEAHRLAASLNKENRFSEAKEAYARMHALEAEATDLAREVGCVACVLGDPTCGVSDVDPEQQQEYFDLLALPPWPQGSDHTAVAARAEGAILGSLVADAAAMGVHWVYDLTSLDTLAEERRAQGGGVEGGVDERAGTSAGTAPGHSGNVGDAGGEERQAVVPLVTVSLRCDEEEEGRVSVSLCCAAEEEEEEEEEVVGLEFMDPPRSPFYAYASGRNSPYGEQTLVLLRSIAQRQGLDCIHYATTFAACFGDGFSGYRDVSTQGFLRNYSRGLAPPATGAADAQANCIARAAPLVAAWAGHPALLARAVRCATRVTQNTDTAVAWACAAAQVLEGVMLGAAPSAAALEVAGRLEVKAEEMTRALREVVAADAQGTSPPAIAGSDDPGGLQLEIATHLRGAVRRAPLSVRQAVAELGRNCHMPNALTTPLHAALHMEYLARREHRALGQACGLAEDGLPWDEELAGAVGRRYVEGVRAAIREGGCCASRASYTGALLGALAGRGGVPEGWQGRYGVVEEVRGAAEAIVRARGRAV